MSLPAAIAGSARACTRIWSGRNFPLSRRARGWRRRRFGGAEVSKISPYFPKFGKERVIKRCFQISDPRGAAGPGLVADDALDRLHMPESPLLEPVLDIDQFFSKLVQVEVLL